ncbi:hypothetical protein FXO38_05321, partial [Capsicum annuum]
VGITGRFGLWRCSNPMALVVVSPATDLGDGERTARVAVCGYWWLDGGEGEERVRRTREGARQSWVGQRQPWKVGERTEKE